MPPFSYIARDAEGRRVDGTVDAADRSAALRLLQQSGLIPLSVNPAAGKPARGGTRKPGAPRPSSFFSLHMARGHKTRMKPREMLIFSRETADLLASGMTLGRALHTLAQRSGDSARSQIVRRLRDEVVQGAALSDALRTYPETFPPLYISMVRAGEASGTLAESLEGLVRHFERVQAARSKVVGAMIYPLIVITVGLLSLVGLMIFIVPRFAGIFEELGGALPLPTRILMAISNGMIHYGWLILLLGTAGGIALQRWLKTEAGRRWWHANQLKWPVIRQIATANAFAHFARTLETLIRNGVPILRALTIVQDTVGNCVLSAEIASARERVTDGSSISGPLAAGNLFPEVLTDMMAVGEETGDLAGALKQIARRYDEELDYAIKVLTTVLEPLLILGVALIVGFVAISMLMAVFDLTSGLQA